MRLWSLPSALGNSALILPLAAGVLALMAATPEGRRGARRWLAAMAVFFATAALIKIAFYGWGIGIHALRLASPSGHATLAMAFWPVFLGLLVSPSRTGWRHAAVAAGVGLGLLCSLSRVATNAHTLSESVVGAALGGCVVLATLKSVRDVHLPSARVAVTGAVLLAALVLWSRSHPLGLPTERWAARTGAWLAGREAPVSKREWLRTGRVVDQKPPRPK